MSFELKRGKCLVVAEVAQAHDGSLGMAHAFIDAAARAGADVVKFQTHIAEAESTPGEPWRVHFSYQDKTRFEYWRRMEFTEPQWLGLSQHAAERGLMFMSSPFSVEAAQLLYRIGVPAWKIASGEIGNHMLFDFLIGTRLPVLVSTGMSGFQEIDRAVERFRSRGIPTAVMQCTSKYPCPPEDVGLNMLSVFRQRYQAPVGLSDHSGTVYPSFAAAALGAEVVEIHVTLSREAFGPDVPSSVTTLELADLVRGVRWITGMLAAPIDKDSAAESMSGMRRLFTKSIVLLDDLPTGAVIERRHLGIRKPGTGIPADQIDHIVGKRAALPLRAGLLLTEADLEKERVQAR